MVNVKARVEGTFELEKIVKMVAVPDISNEKEMSHKSRGQQLVVVMK